MFDQLIEMKRRKVLNFFQICVKTKHKIEVMKFVLKTLGFEQLIKMVKLCHLMTPEEVGNY